MKIKRLQLFATNLLQFGGNIICSLVLMGCLLLPHTTEGAEDTKNVPKMPHSDNQFIMMHAPDFAQWETIHYLVPSSLQLKDSKTRKNLQKIETVDSIISTLKESERVQTIKTGPIKHLIITQSSGPQLEIWLNGNQEIIKKTEDPSPIFFETNSPQNPYPFNFSKTDFLGCEWISPTNYTGVQKIKGKDCMVFEENLPITEPKKKSPKKKADPLAILKSQKSVCIDLLTRLPVMIKKDEDLTIFKFDPAPKEIIAYPPEIQSMIDAREKLIKQGTSMPGRPF